MPNCQFALDLGNERNRQSQVFGQVKDSENCVVGWVVAVKLDSQDFRLMGLLKIILRFAWKYLLDNLQLRAKNTI